LDDATSAIAEFGYSVGPVWCIRIVLLPLDLTFDLARRSKCSRLYTLDALRVFAIGVSMP